MIIKYTKINILHPQVSIPQAFESNPFTKTCFYTYIKEYMLRFHDR